VTVNLGGVPTAAVYKHQRFWVRTDPGEPAGGHPVDTVTEWRLVEPVAAKATTDK